MLLTANLAQEYTYPKHRLVPLIQHMIIIIIGEFNFDIQDLTF